MLAVMVWYPRATVARSNDTSSTSSLFRIDDHEGGGDAVGVPGVGADIGLVEPAGEIAGPGGDPEPGAHVRSTMLVWPGLTVTASRSGENGKPSPPAPGGRPNPVT